MRLGLDYRYKDAVPHSSRFIDPALSLFVSAESHQRAIVQTFSAAYLCLQQVRSLQGRCAAYDLSQRMDHWTNANEFWTVNHCIDRPISFFPVVIDWPHSCQDCGQIELLKN